MVGQAVEIGSDMHDVRLELRAQSRLSSAVDNGSAAMSSSRAAFILASEPIEEILSAGDFFVRSSRLDKLVLASFVLAYIFVIIEA